MLIFLSLVEAIKRVESIRSRRQAQFIRNRLGHYTFCVPTIGVGNLSSFKFQS